MKSIHKVILIIVGIIVFNWNSLPLQRYGFWKKDLGHIILDLWWVDDHCRKNKGHVF